MHQANEYTFRKIVFMQRSKNHHLLIVTIAIAAFLFQLDASIVNISAPSIARYFKVSTSEVSLVILAYLLVVNSTMILFGKLSDRAGIRPVFLAGSGIFAAGSLLCGFSVNVYMLIASRCIQGLGGSVLLTSAFSIIAKFIPGENTGSAFGILSTASALGLTLGAPIGGFITGLYSWQWIFWIQVPLGLAAMICAAGVIPREDNRENSDESHFDIPGALLSFMGLVGLVFSLSMGQELGWTSLPILMSFVMSLVLLSAFILREKRCPNPLLRLSIFRNQKFTVNTVSRFLSAISQGGNLFLLPFYLELLKGLQTGQASLIVAIYSVVLMLTAPLGGSMSQKRGPAFLCSIAMLSASIACAAFAITLQINGLFSVVAFLILLAASFGIFYPSNNRMILEAVPQDMKGTASGVMTTFWTLGLLLGVSFYETIMSGLAQHTNVNELAQGIRTGSSLASLSRGFSYAYILGALSCAGALIFGMQSGGKEDGAWRKNMVND